jgi:hypothetical protein
MGATMLRVLLISALLLAAGHRSFAASSSDHAGFSVELIHRDSNRSPLHDPALSPPARTLAAARRSLDSSGSIRAARSVAAANRGLVSEIVPRSFEYLMSVSLGTPPRQMLAVADTGSDLVWVNSHRNDSAAAATDPAADDDGSSGPLSRAVFDPSRSSTYGVVGCESDACQPLAHASCDANGSCQYQYSYADGTETVGVLSTETFTFRVGGGALRRMLVPGVRFGCSSNTTGTLPFDGLVGLGFGALSLVSQLGAAPSSIGRRFSYCLVPYADAGKSSSLNFGARAVVSDPGAASTPLVASDVTTYYTVELESVAVAGRTVAAKTSRVIVDSGTTLTFLDPALLRPLASELERRIALPRAQSPDQLLDLCYDVRGREDDADWGVPDVTLRFGGGAAVTLKAGNTFALVKEGTLCLVVVTVSEGQPMSILGNMAQQDFHVGYDLDAGTVTFAPADCATSSVSS